MATRSELARQLGPLLRNDRPARFWVALGLDYGLMAGAVLLCEAHSMLWYPLALLVIGTRLHALGILLHDRVHTSIGGPRFNRWFTQIGLAAPIFMSFTNYRNVHLLHHRRLMTDDDLDTTVVIARARPLLEAREPGALLRALLVHYTLSPRRILDDMRGYEGYEHNDEADARRVVVERRVNLALQLAFVVACLATGSWYAPLIYWFLPLVLVTRTAFAMRGLHEHEWDATSGEPFELSVNNYLSWPLRLLFMPHNAHLHSTHHYFPSIPFYNLPWATDVLRRDPGFEDHHAWRRNFVPRHRAPSAGTI